jgi:hypothetical protein
MTATGRQKLAAQIDLARHCPPAIRRLVLAAHVVKIVFALVGFSAAVDGIHLWSEGRWWFAVPQFLIAAGVVYSWSGVARIAALAEGVAHAQLTIVALDVVTRRNQR